MAEKSVSKAPCWAVAVLTTLPLWAGALLVFRPASDIPAVTAMSLCVMYAALLMTMLAGAKWGVVASGAAPRLAGSQMLLAAMFVIAGLVAIIMPPVVGLSVELIGFVVLGFWDLVHAQSGTIQFWFARLRIWSTVLVVAPLVLLLTKVL